MRAYTFYYMLPLNHLDTLFSFSSINHDFLEDDGWVVRSEGEAVDAIGSSRQFQLYHLIHDASGYRWIIDIVDVLRLLVQIFVEVNLYRRSAI